LMEKLMEMWVNRSGLTITVGKEKSPKPIDNNRFWTLVPVTGLEPVRCRQRWLLSPHQHVELHNQLWTIVASCPSKKLLICNAFSAHGSRSPPSHQLPIICKKINVLMEN